MTRYLVSAVKYADAAALLVPAMPELMHAKEVAPRLDGILLTGTPSNLDPQALRRDRRRCAGAVRSGARRDDGASDRSDARAGQAGVRHLPRLSGTQRRVRRHAAARHGRQSRSHPAPRAERADVRRIFRTHPSGERSSKAACCSALTRPTTLDVVSVHYQGVDKLGAGLTVEATAPDGVVEAISANMNGAPILAVQWHPEWKAHENPQSQTFFKLLGRALRREPLVAG